MAGRYLTTEECKEILMKLKKEDMPEDGQELLEKSRELDEARDSFELLERLPLRMFCETQYGKKEGYQDIINQFQQVKERDYDRMLSGACQGKSEESYELASFLAACARTLEVTSMEIYEHYRYLADLLKTTVQQLAARGFFEDRAPGLTSRTASLLGQAIRTGCRLHALSQEKYEPAARDLLARGSDIKNDSVL